MAKGGRGPRQGNGESMSGWFRKAFQEHPAWLKGRSNDALVKLWEEQHPGQKFGERERNSCNNLKSILRRRGRKRGRKPAAEQPGEAPALKVSRGNLELLEERIDECMSLARSLDREGLDSVARLLRKARNDVVWKQGQ